MGELEAESNVFCFFLLFATASPKQFNMQFVSKYCIWMQMLFWADLGRAKMGNVKSDHDS